MARVGLYSTYLRGEKLVGHGTRDVYHGLMGGLRLDVVRFFNRWVGIEANLRMGITTFTTEEKYEGALEAAAVFAPLRWAGSRRVRDPEPAAGPDGKKPKCAAITRPGGCLGAWAGSLVVGLGGGVELGRPAWLHESVHAYPHLLARLRLWPSETVALHASWRFMPISSTDLWVRAHDVELMASVRWVQFGAHARVSEVVGGDPLRTFREIAVSPYIGAVFY